MPGDGLIMSGLTSDPAGDPPDRLSERHSRCFHDRDLTLSLLCTPQQTPCPLVSLGVAIEALDDPDARFEEAG